MKIGGTNIIDFARVSNIPKFIVGVKAGDSKRKISLTLLENNTAINLNNYTVTVACKKSDGNDILNSVIVTDSMNGMCEVEITNQMLALDTDLPCEIILYGKDGSVSTSSNFVISRLSSVRDEASIISSSEFTTLTKALSDVTEHSIYKNKVDTLNTKVNQLSSGSPKGVYTSISELSSSKPSGDTNIYITTDNGHWNYWNGSSWVSGGVYQGMKLADNTVTMSHMNGVVGSYNLYNISALQTGYIDAVNSKINHSTTTASYAKVKIKPNTTYIVARNDTGSSHMSMGDPYVFLDVNGTQVEFGYLGTYYHSRDIDNKRYSKIISNSNAEYICINAKINSFDVSNDPNGIYIIECDSLSDKLDNCLDNSSRIYKIFSRSIEDTKLTENLNALKQSIISSSNNIYNKNNIEITQNMFVDTEGRIRPASSWSMATVQVNPDTMYSIYFGSDIYTSGRGYLSFQTDNRETISFTKWEETKTYLTNNHKVYKTFTTPSDCYYLSFTLKNASRDFNDENDTCLVPGLMNDDDIKGLVIEIDGKKVLSLLNLHEYMSEYNIPTISTSWDDNLLVCAVTRKLSNTLYNNSGKRQSSEGWTAYDVAVDTNTTYYFHSEKENYSVGNRGNIVLLDSKFDILQVIDGQGSNIYTVDNTKWQIIQTTSDTSYIGMTVGTNDGRFDDITGGVLISQTPTSKYLDRYVTAINNIPLKANNAINNETSSLYGKKWVVVGDSLTERNSRATKFYHDYVSEETGCTVVNMGVSGTGYKRQENNDKAFYQRILNIPTDTDIITIFGSGNDLSQTLGTPSDTTTDTICGCMHQTFKNLFSVIPGAKVGVVLPCPWGAYPPSVKDNKMALYCEALKEIACQYSIPVLDLYHGSNLRPWDNTFRELYYKKDDGNTVHPDEDGHKILANKFKMFIQSL